MHARTADEGGDDHLEVFKSLLLSFQLDPYHLSVSK